MARTSLIIIMKLTDAVRVSYNLVIVTSEKENISKTQIKLLFLFAKYNMADDGSDFACYFELWPWFADAYTVTLVILVCIISSSMSFTDAYNVNNSQNIRG